MQAFTCCNLRVHVHSRTHPCIHPYSLAQVAEGAHVLLFTCACAQLHSCIHPYSLAQVAEGAQGYQSLEQKREAKVAKRGETDEIEYGMLREHVEEGAAAQEDM